jgi:anthranilate phosphoribosyltransferase
MSTPAQSNAVLVAIRTPRVTVEELESSLQELTREDPRVPCRGPCDAKA